MTKQIQSQGGQAIAVTETKNKQIKYRIMLIRKLFQHNYDDARCFCATANAYVKQKR